MSREALERVLEQMQARMPAVIGRGEEATKQALVLPMLDALGYDIWNPSEVCPEYDADFAMRKGAQKERVDLAVVVEGKPRIFIEVKSADVNIDAHAGQLSRYFNAVPSVSLGILTNGLEWQFYTDAAEPNLMDPKPFHVSRIDAVDQGVDILCRFHRSQFSPDGIRDYATELEFTAKFVRFLKSELDVRADGPSESFVRWVVAAEGSFEGRMVAKAVRRFSPIVKNSLNIALRDFIRRSLIAMDNPAVDPDQVETETADAADDGGVTPPSSVTTTSRRRKGVDTTENELTAYSVIEGMYHKWSATAGTIFDPTAREKVPTELGFKDTTGYFGVYFNKPAWWIARLVVESKTPWVGFNLAEEDLADLEPVSATRLEPSPYADVRYSFDRIDDLVRLEGLFLAAMERMVMSKERSNA